MSHTHFNSHQEFILAGEIVEYVIGCNFTVEAISEYLNVTKSFIYYCLHIYYLPLPYNPEIEN